MPGADYGGIVGYCGANQSISSRLSSSANRATEFKIWDYYVLTILQRFERNIIHYIEIIGVSKGKYWQKN